MEEDLRGRFGAGGPARTLSAAARRAAAEAGLRLRAFGRDGDRLWLPAPVADAGPAPGLPEVVLESGPLEALPPVACLLAWGEGPRVAALRERWGARPEVDEARALAAPLHEAVWHLPVAPPEVVARVADRSFGLELARERGWALPGAGWAASLPELEHHLGRDRAGEAAGRDDGAGAGRWVLKAPFSAAGRERFLGAGPGDLAEPRARRRVEGLLERHGRLLVEPWVERSADFGAAGLLTSGGVRLASIHRQEVDARGGFRGIAVTSSATYQEGAEVGLSPAERDLLEEAFHAAAEALRGAGYLGPFGIDAFRWRRPGGGEAFHPLCELNPRLTFGLVARAAAERGC